eukprot:jgi/Mesvir1/13008/Mv06011-RA.1
MAPFDGTSTTRSVYTADHITPEVLAVTADRKDLAAYPGHRKDLLFAHGSDPTATVYGTTYAYAHGSPKVAAQTGMKMQSFLWSGKNFSDATVPLGSDSPNSLVAKKMAQWEEDAKRSPYTTSTDEAAKKALAAASESMERTTKCLPKCDGGQEAQIGRKVKGEFTDSLNKPHNVMGLRK